MLQDYSMENKQKLDKNKQNRTPVELSHFFNSSFKLNL